MQILAYLLARFSEPSSYAGLGAVLALLGWHLPDTAVGEIVQILAAVCGLMALGLKERGLLRAIVLMFAVAPLLAGCGAGSSATVYTTADRAGRLIAAGCGEYQRAKAAADAAHTGGALPRGTLPKIAAVESFGDAACESPPKGDPAATAVWLGRLAGQIMTFATPAQ